MDVDSSQNDDASSSTLTDYMPTLPEPLRTFAIRASFSPPSDNDGVSERNNYDDVDDKLDELELSIRGHFLLELVDDCSSCPLLKLARRMSDVLWKSYSILKM